MKLDRSFEIEYIISLTLLILGFLTVPFISNYINFILAFLYMIAVSIHLIIFNFIYILKKITIFETKNIKQLEKINKFSFFVVVFIFSNIIFYIILKFILINFFNFIFCIELISIIISFIISIGLSTYFLKVYKPMKILKKVNVVYSPKKIEIFSNYNDTEPLFFKVVNETPKKQSFKFNMDLPNEVIYKLREEEGTSFIKSLEIESNRQQVFQIYFKYIGTIKKYDEFIQFELKHNKGIFKERIDIMLNPT